MIDEDLEDKGKANVALVGRLLHTSFNEARISLCAIRVEGRKFKIVHGAQTMYLCVARNYLNDQLEQTIKRDFDELDVFKWIRRSSEANPPLLFSSEGIKSIKLISGANAKCICAYEDVTI